MTKMFDLLSPLTKYFINQATTQDNLFANAEE
jgi:hypothetical protein